MKKINMPVAQKSHEKKARVAHMGIRGHHLLSEEEIKELLENSILEEDLEKDPE